MRKFCITCGEPGYHLCVCQEFDVRGHVIYLDLPALGCSVCGTQEIYGVDPAERAFAIYRAHHGLMTPERIREIRENHGLSQEAFAFVVGIPVATLRLYEGGALQTSTHDAWIRHHDAVVQSARRFYSEHWGEETE